MILFFWQTIMCGAFGQPWLLTEDEMKDRRYDRLLAQGVICEICVVAPHPLD